ncbi:MAG: zf-HC2 domain-containing protein [Acidobacteria bacterium]|nr:zf-HC2 domain-containing protein [Acidobacteriota bacterium]MBV9929024.1 zf-HC2 domain-containing protein [Acidobacteriota bacterium]
MDCARSIELLSDYDAGLLGDDDKLFVITHLSTCSDCDGVFRDLKLIVQTAFAMRSENGIAYPDEESLWQRLSASRVVH